MVTTKARGMTWEEVCNDPNLQDLPYKIETNQYGQVVMSPTYQWHGAQQAFLVRKLAALTKEGQVVSESAIRTSEGTRVADAAWYSTERWDQVKDSFDAPIAPEICVEILSPTNTDAEMKDKRQLYVEAGAEEVWICDPEGNVRFFDDSGERETSPRVPDFPKRIQI